MNKHIKVYVEGSRKPIYLEIEKKRSIIDKLLNM